MLLVCGVRGSSILRGRVLWYIEAEGESDIYQGGLIY